jgi:hypothetical protein
MGRLDLSVRQSGSAIPRPVREKLRYHLPWFCQVFSSGADYLPKKYDILIKYLTIQPLGDI